MRRLLLLAGSILWTMLLLVPALADEGELRIDETDTEEHPAVSLLVTAPSELAGVDVSEEFTIIENGAVRPSVARPLAGESLEVLLVVDTSGSMAGAPIAAAKAAATEFAERMPPTTRIGVIGFGSTVQETLEFSDDPDQVIEAIGTLVAAQETALYDAVIAAAQVFDPTYQARRFIILLSDGGDTVSDSTLVAATGALQDGGLGFYAISLDTKESDRAALEVLASATDGRVVPAADADALSGIFDGVASELVSQYEIAYRSAAWNETSVVVQLDHEGSTASTSIQLNLPAPPTTPATTTTEPVAVATLPEAGRTLTPAPTHQVEGPGLLQSGWTLVAGAVLVFLAMVITFFPLTGAARTRGPALQVSTPSMAAAGSLLGRISNRAQFAAEQVLQRGGRDTALNRILDNAGITLRTGEFAVLVVSAAITAFAIGLVLSGVATGLLLAAVALLGSRLMVTIRTDRRRNAFADQLDNTLQLIAGSLRAGYGLLQAVNTVAAEAPAPTSEEFERLVVETRLGRDLVDALDSMAQRVGNVDFIWVVQAIRIQREVGGDLAELLDTVSSTIRDRNQIRRQVRALSAEGRLSAFVLVSLPFALAAFIAVTSPDYIALLFETTAGRIMVAAGAVFMLVGGLWIRRIIKLVF